MIPRVVYLVIIVVVSGRCSSESGQSREYAIAFGKPHTHGYTHPQPSIIIGASEQTNIVLLSSWNNEITEMSIAANTTHVIRFLPSILVENRDGTQNRTVLLNSTNDISVTGYIREARRPPVAFTVTPVRNTDRRFLTTSYDPTTRDRNKNAFVYAVATRDNTVISVQVQISFARRPRMDKTNITLNRGQVYVFAKQRDLTGTVIEADKPIAVFSGTDCSEVPVFINVNTGMLLQQMPNTELLGKNFVIGPLTPTSSKVTVRLVTLARLTSVSVDGQPTRYLSGLQILEYELENGAVVYLNASEKILVSLLKNSGTTRYTTPSMLIVPPLSEFSKKHDIVIPEINFGNAQNAITVYGLSPTITESILINGEVTPPTSVQSNTTGHAMATFHINATGLIRIESVDVTWLTRCVFTDTRSHCVVGR